MIEGRLMNRLVLFAIVSAWCPLAATLLRAQAPPAAETKPVELVLDARPIESPVLKYRLYPAESERRDGNAVPILLRLPWEQTQWMNTVFAKLGTDEAPDWDTLPLESPEWKESRGVLPRIMFEEMKRAAYRRDARWEYPIGETQTPYLILLPDVQGLRGFLGRALSARIRYNLSQGELDEAREGILVGLANARHMAETPFYVNQNVAAVIQRTMLDRTTELVAQPKSPNLYWALTTLPDPLPQFHRAADFEHSMLTTSLPVAAGLNADADTRRTDAQWSEMAKQLTEMLELMDMIPRPKPADQDSVVDQLSKLLGGARPRLAFVSAARQELPELLSVSPASVAAMSDDEAAVRWFVTKQMALDQRLAAAFALPPREAASRLQELDVERKAMRDQLGVSRNDVSYQHGAYLAVWSLKRRVAALRIVEAARDYAAAHENKLPESLAAITSVPVPADPITEQPFVWKMAEGVGTLTAPPPPEGLVSAEVSDYWARNIRVEFRLRIR
jgi:hypothetical protein